MCRHDPPCPAAKASDREAARTVMRDDVQGWAAAALSAAGVGRIPPPPTARSQPGREVR
ncbi:DUF5999 family protein [Streptomyces sp. PRh5]|uniref:DUF5999 family protein n=1 Tax=Streptomyces sp. PRh5 TaxID=1158056 RepID=UPI00240F7504|nr:DUF5999 family protein [Streptomyces sp. PRh5]